ncbi:MAG TPA: NAD(P)-dependent oxidoreductase [Gaiellales bacterium]
MRVLVLDHTYPLDDVRAVLPDAEFATVADGGPGVAGLLVSPDAPVGAGDIARMPDLRVIATASTGTDHIDLDAAAERGIAVHHVAGYCTEEVADHALALLVAGRRGLIQQDRSVQAGEWDYLAAGMPHRLAGTLVAVIGWGRIGRRFGEKAAALEMHVRWWDPLVEGGEPDLEDLLRWADAISLHAPLTPQTEGMIDARRLDMMRPGTILINTARGALVDRQALLEAGHVRAMFDNVWERPPAGDLVGIHHLVITPYVAWLSPETELLPYTLAARAAAEALGLSGAVS